MTDYEHIFETNTPSYGELITRAYQEGDVVGWHEELVPEYSSLFPLSFETVAPHLSGDGKGKKALLWKAMEQVCGKYLLHEQAIGDCVSHGHGGGADNVKCVQIATEKRNEVFRAETATEVVYGLSRVEIGGGRLGNGDGSLGTWAAKAVKQYGTLVREKYTGRSGKEYDFSTYSGKTAKSLGYYGLADELEPVAREHPVQDVALVTTWDALCDALFNGFPVPVCSNQGFASKRDAEGFAKAQGNWAHCMLILGYDDTGRRPGALIQNSWGPNWISGPKKDGQPDGSFWAERAVVEKMLAGRDSFALSRYVGFPGRGPNRPNYDALFGA